MRGGGFEYQSGTRGPNAALTGTGILVLALLGHPDAPEVKAGGDYLLRTPIVQSPNHYFYTVYYCSQAAWQLGGSYWDNINREISSDLLRRQRPDGSWTSASSGDNEGGDSYCTAMAILSLTVPIAISRFTNGNPPLSKHLNPNLNPLILIFHE